MNNEREQPADVDDDSNKDGAAGDSTASDCKDVFTTLVRQNKLVDDGMLNQAIDIATTSGRGILDVLVERGQMSTGMRDVLVAMAAELASANRAQDSSTYATIPPPRLGQVAEETLPPDANETIPPVALGTTEPDRLIGTTAAFETFGDYEIVEEIARGGMGVVYRARQISLNRFVALKKVLSGQLAGEEDIQRFRIEAEASAKLDHPGIVPVYDFGEVDGQHYFSMGFVSGRNLADRINESPFEPREAAELLIKIARAVAYANEHGVIHRDLKPGNVLLDQGGEPRVTDFGLAKQQADDSGMTATGQILGTPSYMPPEQASGKADEVDQRADVYALGAILYATLTGRPPFQAANSMETLLQVLEKEPISVRQLVPGAPKDLETICLKCLHKDAGRRYESGTEFAEDLTRWLNGEPIVARRVRRAERAWKWCRRRPLLVGSVATIVTLILVGSLVFAERQNAVYAAGLVERLRVAETRKVNEIVDELSHYRKWVEEDLRAAFERAAESSPEKLHAGLGLLPFADHSLDYVQQQLLSVPPRDFEYLGVICDALGVHREATVELLWKRFHDPDGELSVRFRAGLALSRLVGETNSWTAADHNLLVEQLVTSSAVWQPELWRLLEPIKTQLVASLETVYGDRERPESEQVAAANALGAFVTDDPERLMDWLMASNPIQFRLLFPVFARAATSASTDELVAVVSQQPNEGMPTDARIALGRRRAKAALILLRRGERESIFDVMRYDDDPEAMTQFIHRCHSHDVPAAALLECLEIVDAARRPLGDERQKVDDSVLYAILTALGDYSFAELPSNRDNVAGRLVEIYGRDPSSGVHSATGWLLRQWGFQEEVNRVDQTPLAYDESGEREWFVEEITCTPEKVNDTTDGQAAQPPKLYFTMIVFPPGEFVMGSPESEHWRLTTENEERHAVRFERTIAVCDRELTWRQLLAKEGNWRRELWNKQFNKNLTLDEPVFGFNWFESIEYCQWLTSQSSRPDSQQCYRVPNDAEQGDWSIALGRTGFRQPTEQEWEYVCRSGTTAAYSFGHDRTWLEKYAWYQNNSNEWSHPVAQLRPNPRGLFDIHGNLLEWCYDWHGHEFVDSPTGPSEGSDRISRGGSWHLTAGDCRSADRRGGSGPSSRTDALGFRLISSLSGPSDTNSD